MIYERTTARCGVRKYKMHDWGRQVYFDAIGAPLDHSGQSPGPGFDAYDDTPGGCSPEDAKNVIARNLLRKVEDDG